MKERRNFWRGKKVLVTGHLGYIGTVMVPMLARAGHDVVGIDSDLYERCTFAPDTTATQVSVTVNGDEIDEDDETFLVNLSGASGGGATIADSQATGTILDDDGFLTWVEAETLSHRLFMAGELEYVSVVVAEQTRSAAEDAEVVAQRDAVQAWVDYVSAIAPVW